MAEYKRFCYKLKDKYIEESKTDRSLCVKTDDCKIKLDCVPLFYGDGSLNKIYYTGSLYLNGTPVKTVNADDVKDCLSALRRWLFEHYMLTTYIVGSKENTNYIICCED